MENLKPKSQTSKIQFTKNWIRILISLPSLYFQFSSIWFFNIQQAFLNIICFIDLKEKLLILKILFINCLNVTKFDDLKISNLNFLNVSNAIPNSKFFKWIYFEINNKLIAKNTKLSEMITIFMFSFRDLKLYLFDTLLVHATNMNKKDFINRKLFNPIL